MKKLLILFDKIEFSSEKEIIYFNEIIQSRHLELKNKNLKNINQNVFEPYGLTEKLLYEDAIYLDKVFEKYLNKISIELNNLHNQNNSLKYWNIILGIWLRDFIYTTYNRFKTLKKGLKKFDINEIILISNKKNNFPILESTTFNKLTNNLLFDAILVSKIFKNLESNKNIKINRSEDLLYQSSLNLKHETKKIRIEILKIISKILNFLSNFHNAKYFVLKSYFGLFEEIKLNFILNKKIQFNEYPSIEYKEKKINLSVRSNLNFNNDSENEFETVLNKIVVDYIPMSVIENYQQVENFIKKKLDWPQNPKLIFTSNSFGDGGPAQFWIAKKTEKGSKYYIGQHGAGYLELYDKKLRTEVKPAEKLIVWGKKIFSDKVFPTFNFTVLNKKENKFLGKKLTIVFRSSGVRTVPFDRFEYGKILYDKTAEIIENLSDEIKKKTLLRLHPNYKKGIYFTFDYFIKKNKYLKIDNKTKYHKLLIDSKIVIFNDFSSGFLQNLTLNYPSIVFSPLGLSFIHEENKTDFEELIKIKLIFTDVKSLNNHLNKIWNNTETWWNDTSNVKVRKIFLEKYSLKPPSNGLNEFSNILKKFN